MKFKNQTLKTIYTRRSIRNYLDKKVPKKIINELLNAAVMAPSAKNGQPWNFHIVSGKENVKIFGEYALEKLNTIIKTSIKLTIKSLFFNAPLLIIISGKKNNYFLKDDINLAVQNMFLAAKSLGLGSCWIGYAMGLNNHELARKKLKIPKNNDIGAILIFGYPKKDNNKIPKRTPKIKKWIE